ncbi:MAG: hypothetical protein WB987_13920 [Candidatus Acidiferrales bacterium]
MAANANPPFGPILQATQQMRAQWSAGIFTLLTAAFTLVIAIWALFLKVAFDSYNACGQTLTPANSEFGIHAAWMMLLRAIVDGRPSRCTTVVLGLSQSTVYILIAVFLSSAVFGLWRWYSRFLDDAITTLYPTLVFCETAMGLPMEYGTLSHLRAAVLDKHNVKIDAHEYLPLVKQLVSDKRIGTRGHFKMDAFAFSLLGLQVVGSPLAIRFVFHDDFDDVCSALITCMLCSAPGFWLVGRACLQFQREPTKEKLQATLAIIRSAK